MEKAMNTGCTIYCLINKQRSRPDGTARIYLRINVKRGGNMKVPLPLYWPVDCFDNEKHELLPRSKDDQVQLTYTTLIELERAKYWRVVKKLLLKDQAFNIKDVVRGVKLGEKGKYLAEYMFFKIKERERHAEIKETTAKNHRCSAKTVLNFVNDDVDIANIDTRWLSKYLVWLLKTMSYSGAWSKIKDLKGYVKLAKIDGATVSDDFYNHHHSPPEHDPMYLEREEIDLLYKMYKAPETQYENRNALRIFLFGCFTGMRISDLQRFNISWIQDDFIVFNPTKKRITDKKDNTLKIPLIPVAKEFLNTLKSDSLETRSAVKYNKRLKTIAAIAGVKKKLTAHVSRHTFGTSLAILGVPVIIISKLMGHKSIISTMIYIHIAEKIKAKEMDKLQNAFSSYTLSPVAPSAELISI
ncbi:integrase/recombinase XerD [Pedobacter sp. UYP24]